MADLLWALTLAGQAAAPATPPPAAVETIIVTGERVPRSLRETPSSVAVITSDEIEAQGADRVEQLLALVPNVQLGSGEEGRRSAARTRPGRSA